MALPNQGKMDRLQDIDDGRILNDEFWRKAYLGKSN